MILKSNGVSSIDDMRKCTDSFLVSIGMKPAHLIKFHRALVQEPDPKDDTPITANKPQANENELGLQRDLYEAPDGFRGTYDEVCMHEEEIKVAKASQAASEIVQAFDPMGLFEE